ncbi:uncharacterized protein LOC125306006 [Alosa alosa]|uniref:uncharacterized protein LOC125306006 n=1 Tax=Alosa alosa TaxID=278164 RepID=UPI0020150BC8|nr:uncharacterized protein LOC125306006 [Alosa alosa]
MLLGVGALFLLVLVEGYRDNMCPRRDPARGVLVLSPGSEVLLHCHGDVIVDRVLKVRGKSERPFIGAYQQNTRTSSNEGHRMQTAESSTVTYQTETVRLTYHEGTSDGTSDRTSDGTSDRTSDGTSHEEYQEEGVVTPTGGHYDKNRTTSGAHQRETGEHPLKGSVERQVEPLQWEMMNTQTEPYLRNTRERRGCQSHRSTRRKLSAQGHTRRLATRRKLSAQGHTRRLATRRKLSAQGHTRRLATRRMLSAQGHMRRLATRRKLSAQGHIRCLATRRKLSAQGHMRRLATRRKLSAQGHMCRPAHQEWAPQWSPSLLCRMMSQQREELWHWRGRVTGLGMVCWCKAVQG